MSGVLGRLVARATGQAVSGLRPRAPARFEDAGATGSEFRPVSEDVVARPPDPARAMERAPRDFVPGPATDAEAGGHGMHPAHADTTPPPMPPRRTVRPPPPHPPPRAGRVAPPPPSRSDGDVRAARMAPTSTRADTAADGAGPNTADVRSVDSQRAFMPILPPRKSAETNNGRRPDAGSVSATPTGPPAHARQAQGTSDVSDITIHIGRIELHGDPSPSKVPSARRAKPTKSITSLSDYLKGGGR